MKFPSPSNAAAPYRRLSLRREDSMWPRPSRSADTLSPPHNYPSTATPSPSSRKAPISRPAKSLDNLTEEELTRLTQNNTKRNHGGRKGRFRSQMERVCRRLDNMAVEAHLQHRVYLQALPVVEPEDAVVALATDQHATDPPPDPVSPERDDSQQSMGLDGVPEDCFAIEPATNDSIFSSRSAKSVASGRPKSVRISTSVCFLEYNAQSRSPEPLSVSRRKRLQHPTRMRNHAQVKSCAEQMTFPRAKLRTDAVSKVEHNGAERDRNESRSEKKSPSAKPSPVAISQGVAPLRTGSKESWTPRKLVTSGSSSTKAAYAVKSPNGAYGPRNAPKGDL